MSSTAYHNEALRKQRVLERKKDAQMRMKQAQMDLSAESGHRMTTNQVSGPDAAEFKRKTVYDRPIRHRKMDNTPKDHLWTVLIPREETFIIPPDQLPPRVPHFKV